MFSLCIHEDIWGSRAVCSVITSPLDRGERLARYTWNRRLGGSYNRSGSVWEV